MEICYAEITASIEAMNMGHYLLCLSWSWARGFFSSKQINNENKLDRIKFTLIFNKRKFDFFYSTIFDQSCRSPPFFMELYKKSMEEKRMNYKNDYKNSDFWVKKDDCKNNIYYVKIRGKWLEVTKEVFLVYKNSYQKMYRDAKREQELVKHYGNIDTSYSKFDNCLEVDFINDIVLKDKKKLIQDCIRCLTPDEQLIIVSLYYYDMTEKQVADKLHLSQQLLHYRKKKVLKKLKILLLNKSKTFIY